MRLSGSGVKNWINVKTIFNACLFNFICRHLWKLSKKLQKYKMILLDKELIIIKQNIFRFYLYKN